MNERINISKNLITETFYVMSYSNGATLMKKEDSSIKSRNRFCGYSAAILFSIAFLLCVSIHFNNTTFRLKHYYVFLMTADFLLGKGLDLLFQEIFLG